MLQKLGMEEDKISEMCALLYKHYGTTMAGLRVCFTLQASVLLFDIFLNY